MIGTFTSLILALVLLFFPIGQVVTASWNPFAILIGIVATLLLLLTSLVQAISWSPLMKAEKGSSSRLLEVMRQDSKFKLSMGWFIVFPLLSYALALFGGFLEVPMRTLSLAIWVFLFGMSLDVFHNSLKRIMSYLNPYGAIEHFHHFAKKSIQNDREIELCDMLDALSETAVNGMKNRGTSVSLTVLDKMQDIFRGFLEASKSVAHPQQNQETAKLGISDKSSYTLFYLLQRFEFINQLAAEKTLEPVCSRVVTTLGKIVFYSAKYDISLAPFPIQTLGKGALLAMQKGLSDVGVKAIITLLEVSRTILQEIDVTYLELQEPYKAVINQMSDLSREAFKQDKSLNIALLKQPFLQLRELFTSEKMAVHPDTAVIVDRIDRAVAEFTALEAVMKSLPPMPVLTEDKLPKGPVDL